MSTLFKATGILILALFATLASGSALAQHHGHGYGGYGHGGSVRFGISLGVPLYGPGYYGAHYYGYPAYAYPAPVYGYPPVVMSPALPPVYVERGAVQAAPAPSQAQGDWYFCAASNAYYPYVAECPAGWQRVPAQPASR